MFFKTDKSIAVLYLRLRRVTLLFFIGVQDTASLNCLDKKTKCKVLANAQLQLVKQKKSSFVPQDDKLGKEELKKFKIQLANKLN